LADITSRCFPAKFVQIDAPSPASLDKLRWPALSIVYIFVLDQFRAEYFAAHRGAAPA
jgi:hypothetical protein